MSTVAQIVANRANAQASDRADRLQEAFFAPPVPISDPAETLFCKTNPISNNSPAPNKFSGKAGLMETSSYPSGPPEL